MPLRSSAMAALATLALCGALGASGNEAAPTKASAPALLAERPPSLLFWSGFEGPLSLSAPYDCYNNGCYQKLTGTDSKTGFSWPFSLLGGDNRFQLLVNGPPATPKSVGQYMFNELQTVVGPKGRATRALYSEVRQSGCCGAAPQGNHATQNVLHVFPGGEPGDLYMSKWMKFQPDLAENLRIGAPWRVVFEWKEGGYLTKGGAFRVLLSVVFHRRLRAPAWQVTWDNDANGGYPYQRYWRTENRSVPVPIGEWFKLELFWHRSPGSDGRAWFAVNGQVIDDHYGRTIGVRNDPVGRIMINQVYSGAAYPIYQWSDDIQIWHGFPTAKPDDPWYDPPYAPH